MSRVQKFAVIAVAVAACVAYFLASAPPAAAQGFIIVPVVDCVIGDNGWCVSTATVTWNLEEGSTINDGCETTIIDFDTDGYPVFCDALTPHGHVVGGALIKVDTTAPEPGCNVAPGDVLYLDEGDELPLDCSGSNDNLSAVTASFDTNEDGVFGDAPVFYAIDEVVSPCWITVLLADEAGNETHFTVQVFIANVAPLVKITDVVAQNGTFNIGGQVDLFLSIDDPGVNDTHTVIIDWGDGTTTIDQVISPCFIHVYNAPGTYTVVVTVVDNGGAASAPVSTAITIDDPGGTINGIEAELLQALQALLITEGQATSLGAPLDGAQNSLDNGVYPAAAGQLRAFAYHGFAELGPDSSVTPCFTVALETAAALDGLVPPPD